MPLFRPHVNVLRRVASDRITRCTQLWLRLRSRPLHVSPDSSSNGGAGWRARGRARRQRSFPSPVAFLPRALNSLSRLSSVSCSKDCELDGRARVCKAPLSLITLADKRDLGERYPRVVCLSDIGLTTRNSVISVAVTDRPFRQP